MATKQFTAIALAVSTLAVSLPVPAFAEHRDHREWSQDDDNNDEDGDHHEERRQYQRDYDHDQQNYDEHYARDQRDYRDSSYDRGYRCHRDGTTGLIVGALAGGYLGNRVAGRHHRTVGTIVGGAGGALAGRAIDRNC